MRSLASSSSIVSGEKGREREREENIGIFLFFKAKSILDLLWFAFEGLLRTLIPDG